MKRIHCEKVDYTQSFRVSRILGYKSYDIYKSIRLRINGKEMKLDKNYKVSFRYDNKYRNYQSKNKHYIDKEIFIYIDKLKFDKPKLVILIANEEEIFVKEGSMKELQTLLSNIEDMSICKSNNKMKKGD